MCVIERVDHPAVARVNADVSGPPQNIAGADLLGGNFLQRVRDVAGGSRNFFAGGVPCGLDEPGAIEAMLAGAAPTVRFADLRARERAVERDMERGFKDKEF